MGLLRPPGHLHSAAMRLRLCRSVRRTCNPLPIQLQAITSGMPGVLRAACRLVASSCIDCGEAIKFLRAIVIIAARGGLIRAFRPRSKPSGSVRPQDPHSEIWFYQLTANRAMQYGYFKWEPRETE